VITEIGESLAMDVRDAESRITGTTGAIMPVHMLGNPADIDAVRAMERSISPLSMNRINVGWLGELE
jgi:dTDP-4-amino-4,6-dideoxygalactose transaminase